VLSIRHGSASTQYQPARLSIKADGKIGIGTDAPANLATLDVRGRISVRENVAGELQFGTAAAYTWMEAFDGSADRTPKLPIAINPWGGNVGIGTSAPGYNLEVAASSATWLSRIYNTHGGVGNGLLVRVDSTSSDAIFSAYSAGSHRFVIKGDGKVGIGTYSPAQKLDVEGDIRIRDARSLFFKRHGDNYAWRVRNESASDSSTYGFDGANDLVFEVVSNSNTNATPGASSHSIYGSTGNTLVLKETGRVGIGTAAPSAKLAIDNSTDQLGLFIDSDYRENTRFHSTESGQGTRVWITNSSITSNKGYGFVVGDATGGADKMTIGPFDSGGSYEAENITLTRNGKVGIGAVAPSAKLHVYATGDQISEASAAFWIGDNATGAMALYGGVNNTNNYAYIGSVRTSQAYESLILNPNGGNVGIGTTAPGSYLLYVAGTTYLGNDVTIGSGKELNVGSLITVTQDADNDGIRFRGYDDVNSYYGKIGLNDVGYLQVFAEGNRSIDLKSGRQIRFYTSTDNSTYNNSVTFQSDGTSLFSGAAEFDGGIKDANGNLGTSGQFLQTNGSDVVWANVSTGTIADDAVTQAKIADGSVGTSQLVSYSVSSGKIANNAVTGDKLAGWRTYTVVWGTAQTGITFVSATQLRIEHGLGTYFIIHSILDVSGTITGEGTNVYIDVNHSADVYAKYVNSNTTEFVFNGDRTNGQTFRFAMLGN
jgi:hypothetical protein